MGQRSTTITATELTILVDQRETSNEEDEGAQQPQVVQTTQKEERQGSNLCKASGVNVSNAHRINSQDHNNQRVVS